MWNEPNFEAGAEETLKNLFGGDACPVRVKYQAETIMRKTPIIILANRDIFPKNKAFNTRMYRKYWTTCDQLKNFKKKPIPIAAFYLLIRYNVIDRNKISLEMWENEMLNKIQL